MTPKEKAEELVLKFKEVPMGYGFNEVMWSIPSNVVRLLALRCVDEIQNTDSVWDNDTEYRFYEEVKKEIKLL
jgi:hypothetical protein